MAEAKGMTHEGLINAVRQLVIERVAPGTDEHKRLAKSKLVYGMGGGGYRGITVYGAWKSEGHEAPVDFMEISARGEENPVQVAGTTIHELAHCLAGPGAGHGKAWKDACGVLGLNARQAGGQDYTPNDFDPALWEAIAKHIDLVDGKPNWVDLFRVPVGANAPANSPVTFGRLTRKHRPCPLGIGTRGGKSRGTGSGSRLRLWECECTPTVKVRVASDKFAAHCDVCGKSFKQVLPVVIVSTGAAPVAGPPVEVTAEPLAADWQNPHDERFNGDETGLNAEDDFARMASKVTYRNELLTPVAGGWKRESTGEVFTTLYLAKAEIDDRSE